MRLEIVKTGINGEGIGFFKRKPVFVEGCFEGELVDADLKDEGNHYTGTLRHIVRKSDRRVVPKCRHCFKCGACALMELDHRKQLDIKKELLQGALYKYAKIDEELDDIVPSKKIFGYRNKLNLPVIEHEGRLYNAIYKKGSNHPCLIEDCPIHEEGLEKMRKQILDVLNRHHLKAYERHEKKGIRQLIVRGFGKSYQAVLVTGSDVLQEDLVKDLKKIKHLDSLFQGINTVRDPVRLMPDKLRCLFGRQKIEMKAGDYKLLLSPQAFFQLNLKQAERIYGDAAAMIQGKKKLIIEAYCGIGAISMYLHDKAEKIIGIELIEKAVRDAQDNAKLNGFDNLEFRADDAAKEVRRILAKEKADVLIVDPPRTGLDDELIVTLLKSKIDQIIYISCNPATLGKDLDLLKQKYQIARIQGYDMFPNTPHVETVCCLYHQKKDFISVPYEPKNVE
ncbi:MAG: 23S rRNA (uracil(1939)-C(5))-methyltransferase RlmD [Erysipelotrichaceae bacterium]|nr:23S rRNA (uracil(1939)-C(5))-methyltransferase RlmD [Erysipelotrichaceae bacterium]